MKTIINIAALFFLLCIAFGCGGGEKQPEPTAETPAAPKVPDYLGEDVVLAALMWQESFSAAQFYPSKLEKEKDGQYEVTTLAGSPDIGEGEKYTTAIISLQSHPAQQNELKVGTVVLFTGDEIERTEGELKNARWNRGVIASIGNVNEMVVKIGTYDNLSEGMLNQEKVHIKNLRISDKPIFKGPENL
ncbi:MAG: hypothetical protein WBB37_04575 [bacterium]